MAATGVKKEKRRWPTQSWRPSAKPAGRLAAGLMLVLPVGGFLCLGTLIAVMQWALARSEKKAAEKNEKEGN